MTSSYVATFGCSAVPSAVNPAAALAQLDAGLQQQKLTAGAAENIRKWLTEPRYAPYAAEVAQHLVWHFEQAGLDPEHGPPLEDLVTVQADRVKTLKEMTGQSKVFYEDLGDYDEGSAKKHLRPVAEEPLRAVGSRLADLARWEPELLNEAVRLTAEELEIGLGKIAQPLRVALTGTGVSPSIDKTLWLIGRERSLERISRALAYVMNRAAAL